MTMMVGKKMVRIDLHSHSQHSDGKSSVRELLRDAKKRNVQLFAVTDHDTPNGSLEAWKLNQEENFSVPLVTGIEFSVLLPPGVPVERIHMLALGIDLQSSALGNLSKLLQDSRVKRAKQIVTKLQDLGINIAWDDLPHDEIKGSIGRPHIARTLVQLGVVSDVKEAFEKYLKDGAPAYVPKMRVPLEDAMKITKQLDGLAVWAHPLLECHDIPTLETILELLINHGLGGIEYYYPYEFRAKNELPPKKTLDELNAKLDEFIKARDLIRTAGCDYHGDRGEVGCLEVPEKILNELLAVLTVMQ